MARRSELFAGGPELLWLVRFDRTDHALDFAWLLSHCGQLRHRDHSADRPGAPSAAPRSPRASRAMCERHGAARRGGRKDGRRDRSPAPAGRQGVRADRQGAGRASATRSPIATRAARGKLVDQGRASCARPRTGSGWPNVPKAEALIATAKEMLAEAPSRRISATACASSRRCGRKSARCRSAAQGAVGHVQDDLRSGLRQGARACAPSRTRSSPRSTKVKEALIAEAEALADSTDWARHRRRSSRGCRRSGRSRVTCRASRATSCGSGSAPRATSSSSAASRMLDARAGRGGREPRRRSRR